MGAYPPSPWANSSGTSKPTTWVPFRLDASRSTPRSEIRSYRWELAPGATSATHTHERPYLVIAGTDLGLRMTAPGGGVMAHAVKAGDVHGGEVRHADIRDESLGRRHYRSVLYNKIHIHLHSKFHRCPRVAAQARVMDYLSNFEREGRKTCNPAFPKIPGRAARRGEPVEQLYYLWILRKVK